jgi:hypothetical protein
MPVVFVSTTSIASFHILSLVLCSFRKNCTTLFVFPAFGIQEWTMQAVTGYMAEVQEQLFHR